MAVVEWTKDGSVAVVNMINGENRVNPAFINGMLDVLTEVEKDESIGAVLIKSGDSKNWSQGIDLPWMDGRFAEKDLQSVRNFFYSLSTLFKKMLLYPVPIIAAINGHCAAMGVIFACACDFMFMKADRGFFFLPEIDVEIAFQPGFYAIVQKNVPSFKLKEMLYTGKKYTAAELDESHVLKACENEAKLMEEATALAKSFNKKRSAFHAMKRITNGSIIDILDKQDPAIVEPLRMFPPY